MFTFNHSGNIVNLLHSLYFCKELIFLGGFKKFDLHIQNNVIENGINVNISHQQFKLIKPLLENQDYINEVTFSNNVPTNVYNLTGLNTLRISNRRGFIANKYYNLTPFHLPREFWKPILQVKPNHKFKDKILIYINPEYTSPFINFKTLEKYKQHLLFVDFEGEYNKFIDKFFFINKIKYDNYLDLAQYIAGAKGFIGNQGVLFSIADSMKIPRILIAPELDIINQETCITLKLKGQINVNQPHGGWYEFVATNNKLQGAIIELLKYKKE